jgi:hypothetical protein
MVMAALRKQDRPNDPAIWLNAPDIVKLLRKEHRAVVRMVKQLARYSCTGGRMQHDQPEFRAKGVWILYHRLLDQLNERAQ